MKKSHRTFNLSLRCWELMHEMSLELGLRHGEIIEIAIREMYPRITGKRVSPIIEDVRKRYDF